LGLFDHASTRATARVQELREQIERHNRLYYEHAAPEISDYEFDALLRELADLGGVEEALHDTPHWRKGVYLYHGQVTSASVAQTLDQPFTDLDLLL
jgi:DNA ligase (NAD+)